MFWVSLSPADVCMLFPECVAHLSLDPDQIPTLAALIDQGDLIVELDQGLAFDLRCRENTAGKNKCSFKHRY